MLMLTHTNILQQFLESQGVRNMDPDIYIYNIAPDLLTIHPDIHSQQTHGIRRFVETSADYPDAAYVIFHLLVDDVAHFGRISMVERTDDFDPESGGYSYIKGKPLIDPICDLYGIIHRGITHNEAAYRSHLIIEMIYDLVIEGRIKNDQSIEVLENAVHYTLENKSGEFASHMRWLYGIDEEKSIDVLKSAVSYITRERMKRIMNIEGRIRLFADKFGLKDGSDLFNRAMESLFVEALNSVTDEAFLQQTHAAISTCGWRPPE